MTLTDDDREPVAAPLPPNAESPPSSASADIENPDPPLEFPWEITEPETGDSYTFQPATAGALRSLIISSTRTKDRNEWTYSNMQAILDAFGVGLTWDEVPAHRGIWWANRTWDAFQMATIFPDERQKFIDRQRELAKAVVDGVKAAAEKKTREADPSTDL